MTYVPLPGDGRPQVVTLLPGDGIGPELTDSVTKIVDALGAPIVWERFNNVSGTDEEGMPNSCVPEDVIASIKRNGTCLKGTLFTPLGKTTSTQSLNVQLRKQLDLHVNLVHGFSMPGLETRHTGIDIVVIRENTEGEYSGLEHEVVPGVVESLKVITAEKSRRTAQYAFEYALLNNRKTVTAIHKANIMKLSDGLFLRECTKASKAFDTIKFDSMIVDNTCMQLTGRPDQFDVMVTPNLYGNLVTNVVAGLCGGPGVCPGANIGKDVAIFEQGARHVAKDIVGLGIANPIALLLSTSMLLRHLQLHSYADRLEDSIMAIVASGDKSLVTPDIGGTGTTASFTNAVIKTVKC